MSFSLVYLVHRVFYRIYAFIKHWYVGSFFEITRRTIGLLERLDYALAVKVTLRYFFKPLYQDYSVLGYVMGFIFRSVRVFSGCLVYLGIILVAIAIYILWACLPLYIIARGFLKI